MENQILRNESPEWTQALPNLYQSQSHADLTLVCERKRILVHRSILASLSPLFAQLLVGCESCIEPVILLEGFRYAELMLLVNFLYNGIAEGSSEEILMVSKYGKELQVRGLVSSGQNTKPLKLELLQVKEQLKKLQTNHASDSESSSEDEELQIVYEKNTVATTKPNATVTETLPLKCSSGRKRTISSSSSVPSILPKKRAPQEQVAALVDTGVGEFLYTRPFSSKIFKCSICKEIFATKPSLKIHLGSNHSDELTCSICDKIFSARSTLKKHLKNHISKLDGLISSTSISTLQNSSDLIQIPPHDSAY